MSARNFFTDEQQQTIRNAIVSAELNTSGEIRVHIDEKCEGDVLAQAAIIFSDLKMDKTDQRNGVLFYLAVADKMFAILGDKGINEKVPAGFWDNIRDTMLGHFKKDEFTEGLSKGIQMAGEKLITHFPYHRTDVNELENEITFGKLK
jgi:uncharacterized membrane protein